MPINIVMYHYVRNNEEYEYDTFCRRRHEFESQIDFFVKSSSIIDPKDSEKIKYFLKNDEQFCYLLTFDDGYKDHLYCAEYLSNMKLSGYFFPPINAINGSLLDVNAIHILIGKRGLKVSKILEKITEICLSLNYFLNLNNQKLNILTYKEKFNTINNYDDRNTQMLKRILQRDLIGGENRKLIIDILIKEFIDKNHSDIVNKFYLNLDDLIEMKEMGMSFGSHGISHRWLNRLNYSEQKYEIEKSFIALKKFNILAPNDLKVMCYPFGSYNQNTIKLMKELKIDLGLTTKIGSSILKNQKDYIFKLPRWDTNNLWDNKWRRPCREFY